MTREQIEELAALDALDALDGEALAAWEAICQTDASAARWRDEMADVAAQLSLLATEVEAPVALRERVMTKVFSSSEPVSSATEAVAGRHDFWTGWAAAAAIMALALVGISATTRQKESVVVHDGRPDAGAPYVALTGYGDFTGTVASVLWDSGQRGWWVQAAGLPALPPTHRYHVWAIGEGEGQIYDCGELPRRSGGLARRFMQPPPEIKSMQGFVVSIEPVGRAGAKPSSPAVLITPALRG
jgi:hypothetical protein